MNIQTITESLINHGIEENEAKKEIQMLLEHFCNYTQKDAILGKTLTEAELNLINEKINIRINEGMPVQYIIGEAYFMGEFFKVSPDVLIPRDETEILVRRAIQIIKQENFKNILDIGTGSGCIACTIANQTEATVLGVDISSDALRIALDNVTKLKINNKAVFRKSNLFEKVRDDEKFDMIISNPPYIPIGTELSREVQHEPDIALFAEENGLKFYKDIVKDAPKFLNKNGYLIFELGIDEADDVRLMLLENGFTNIYVEKDLFGINRVIWGKYTNNMQNHLPD